MDEFLKMDIFFVVTTMAVVTLTVAVLPLLWRLARILKNLERISSQVLIEGNAVREDLAFARNEIRGTGRLIKSLFRFFTKLIKRMTSKH